MTAGKVRIERPGVFQVPRQDAAVDRMVNRCARAGAARAVARCGPESRAWPFQFVPGDCRNAISLPRSSADVRPPYGFMLLPGTTSSGFAMKLSSFSLSHTKSAPFIALE